MSTVIRPEISKKNKYHISKHRYYELKHFCLQYPDWKKAYYSLNGLPNQALACKKIGRDHPKSDTTAIYAEARLYFRLKMEMLENAAKNAAGDLDKLMIRAVTEGLSYDCLRAQKEIPCCKDVWYTLYRRFFWMLDKARQ